MLASTTGMEEAGNNSYQNDHMSRIFSQGFSFSGFERDKLYLSLEGEKFVDISGLSGLDSVTDGRGAAYGDFDNDGDYDVFLTTLQGQVHHLFRNNVGQEGNFVRVALEGRKSGRNAYGSEVRLKTSAGLLTKIKAGGSGFVSQSDPRLLFGLGREEKAEWLEVRWPSGERQRFEGIAAGSSVKVIEGKETLEFLEAPRTALPDPAGDEALFLQALRYGPGDEFPAVKMIDAEQGETDFHAYRKPGRAYLVNFWATYCVPCREEMPQLQKLAADLKASGVEVVGISLDMGKQRAKVPRFLQRMGVTYPVFTTEESVFAQIFSREEIFIPLSFLIDEQGRITDVLTGWSETAENRIRGLIR